MILGHGRLHEPGAGARQAGRQAHRHLGVRLRALRDAHRSRAFPGPTRVRHDRRHPRARAGVGALPAATPPVFAACSSAASRRIRSGACAISPTRGSSSMTRCTVRPYGCGHRDRRSNATRVRRTWAMAIVASLLALIAVGAPTWYLRTAPQARTAGVASRHPKPRQWRCFHSLLFWRRRPIFCRWHYRGGHDGAGAGRVGGLGVIASSSAFKYRHTTDLREIARGLRVGFVVRGSVLRAGGIVQIDAKLVDARDAKVLWSQGYSRELNDLLTVQDDIARQIATILAKTFGSEPEGEVAVAPHEKQTRTTPICVAYGTSRDAHPPNQTRPIGAMIGWRPSRGSNWQWILMSTPRWRVASSPAPTRSSSSTSPPTPSSKQGVRSDIEGPRDQPRASRGVFRACAAHLEPAPPVSPHGSHRRPSARPVDQSQHGRSVRRTGKDLFPYGAHGQGGGGEQQAELLDPGAEAPRNRRVGALIDADRLVEVRQELGALWHPPVAPMAR